jgi:hypothetical protein
VTLILGLSKAEGIYLSVDYRVTWRGSGNLVDDDTVKFLNVNYPGGPKALFAYTGIARLPGSNTDVGDWLRIRVSEGPAPFNDSMHYLRRRLDTDIAPRRQALIVNVLAIHDDNRYLGGFSNSDPYGAISSSFEYQMERQRKPFSFGNGMAARRFFSMRITRYSSLLSDQLSIQPNHPRDHMKLLWHVNREISKIDRTVSPHCHVSFINADGRYPPAQEAFAELGQPKPVTMPIVDLTRR